MALVRPSVNADDNVNDHGQSVPDGTGSEGVVLAEFVDADEPGEDIAPGVIEFVPYREARVTRAGSAAMVAAVATARGAGLTARLAGRIVRYFSHGTRSTAYLGYRYVRAHDHIEALGGMNGPSWRKVHDTRARRWRVLGWTFGSLTAADLFSWAAITGWAHVPALSPEAWAAAPGAEAILAGAVLTLYGRYRLHASVAPEEIVAPEDTDDGQEPFPLAWCRDGGQVEECVARAYAAEGINTRQIRTLGHRPWGWEVDVVTKGAGSGKVMAASDQLDAHFAIKHGGTMPEADLSNAAHHTLRLVTDNPFENMPLPQPAQPNSLDISDAHHFGQSMDGKPLEIVLEGTRVLVIGSSGSAKSTGVLRDLAEVITACHNAIALDLDPVKDGLREFEGVMAAPPIRGNQACEEWLEYLVRMAEGRNRVRNRLKMGDTWVATREHPAIFPIVDEFIFLSKPAKQLFIDLLRIGKQSGIYPVAAGQDATSEAMGDAIADTFTLRIMLAARHADIPIVFGKGAIDQGFRPDRLVPAQNAQVRNDAGQSFIKGAGMTRPVLWGWNEHSNAGIRRAVEERVKAGRPWFDDDSLAEADLLHELSRFRPGRPVDAAVSVADRLDALGTVQAGKVAGLLRLFDERRADFVPTAEVVAAGIVADGGELQRLLAGLVPGATSSKPTIGGVQVRGWERGVVERAASALIAPS